MKKLFLLFCICLMAIMINAQKISESYVPVKDSVQVGKRSFLPCTNKGYTLIEAEAAKAVVVFFTENKPDTSTKYYKEFFAEAAKKHLSALFICRGKPFDFFFDKKDMDDADVLLSVALRLHNLKDKPIVLAGEGLAGTRALQFVKYYRRGQSSNLLDIKAIALFDSPLDMVRLYKSSEQSLKMNPADSGALSSQYITYLLKLRFGSKPKSYLVRYLDYSTYSFWDDNLQNIGFYKSLPVRAYTEPGIEWWLNIKHKTVYETNMPDMTGLIQALQFSGNKYSELIVFNHRRSTEHGPAYTFALANKEELVHWFMDQISRP